MFKFFFIRTYLKTKPVSWVDSYFEYLESGNCCYKRSNESGDQQCFDTSMCGQLKIFLSYLQILIIKKMYSIFVLGPSSCERCWKKEEWPKGGDFNRYVPFFLRQSPNSNCVKAGLGQFDDSVRYSVDPGRNSNVRISSKF